MKSLVLIVALASANGRTFFSSLFLTTRSFARRVSLLDQDLHSSDHSHVFFFFCFSFYFFCDRQPFRSSLQFPLIPLHHITTNQQKHQQPTTSTHFNNAKGRVEKVQPKDRAPLKGEEGREGCRLSLCRLCCQPCFRTPFQQGSRSAYLEEPLGRSGNC